MHSRQAQLLLHACLGTTSDEGLKRYILAVTAAAYIQNVPCEHKGAAAGHQVATEPITTTTHHCVHRQQALDSSCLQTSTQALMHGASTPDMVQQAKLLQVFVNVPKHGAQDTNRPDVADGNQHTHPAAHKITWVGCCVSPRSTSFAAIFWPAVVACSMPCMSTHKTWSRLPHPQTSKLGSCHLLPCKGNTEGTVPSNPPGIPCCCPALTPGPRHCQPPLFCLGGTLPAGGPPLAGPEEPTSCCCCQVRPAPLPPPPAA